jgi:hypothetical protein
VLIGIQHSLPRRGRVAYIAQRTTVLSSLPTPLAVSVADHHPTPPPVLVQAVGYLAVSRQVEFLPGDWVASCRSNQEPYLCSSTNDHWDATDD